MSKLLLAFHGGKMPENEEIRTVIMKKWDTWFSGLDDAVVDTGMAVGLSKTVSSTSVQDIGALTQSPVSPS